MPTITDQSLDPALAARLNSIMLRHAHRYFLPLNYISLLPNILLTTLWFWLFRTPYDDVMSLSDVRAALPAALSVLATAHTVRFVLPINARVHELAREMSGGKGQQNTTTGDHGITELCQLQLRWAQLNGVRCYLLSGAALSCLTSPAVASLYGVLAP